MLSIRSSKSLIRPYSIVSSSMRPIERLARAASPRRLLCSILVGSVIICSCPAESRCVPRCHRLHLLDDEADGGGLLVGRVLVLHQESLDRRPKLGAHVVAHGPVRLDIS